MSQLRDTKNKRTITKFLLLICLSLFGLKLQAQQAYVLADEKQGDYLLNNTSVLLDINGNQHPDSLIWGSAAKSFIPFSEYKWAKANPKSVLWLKIAVNNVSDHDILAFINWGYSSKIDAHIANVSKVTQTYHLGYSRERQQNIYSTPLYEGNLVLFRANPSETTLLVGYQCVDNMEIGIKLQNRELISEHEQKSNLLLGAFFGILLIMSIYHFLIYLNIKDRSYILYILYIAAVSITFLRTHSFLTNLFTGDIRLNFFTFTIFTDNLMTPAYFLFTRKYIKLKNISPKWDKTLLWMIRIRLMLIFALLVFFRTTHNINVTLLFINISLLIEIIIFAFSFQTIYKRGDLVAKYFIVGTMLLFSISVIAVFFLVLKPNTSWGTISIECGVILQILVFAAGFGKKLKLDEAEKLGVQGQLIEQLKQNELLQTKVNRELEGKVKERTHEIILQKEEIQAQMEELELSNKIIKKKEYTNHRQHPLRKTNTRGLPALRKRTGEFVC